MRVSIVPLIAYSAGVLIQILLGKFSGKRYWNSLHAPVLSAIIVYLMAKEVLHAALAFIFVNLAYLIIHNCKKGIKSVS